MSLIINGTEISNVVYNGTELDKIVYNGTEVFTKTTTPVKKNIKEVANSLTQTKVNVWTNNTGASVSATFKLTIYDTKDDGVIYNIQASLYNGSRKVTTLTSDKSSFPKSVTKTITVKNGATVYVKDNYYALFKCSGYYYVYE